MSNIPPIIQPPPPVVYVQQAPRSNTWIVIVGALILLIVLVVGLGIFVDHAVVQSHEESSSVGNAAVPASVVPPSLKDLTRPQIGLAKFNWSLTKYGYTIGCHFTVTNNSPSGIKDLEIEYVQYGHSGTPISTNYSLLYEVVGAGQTKEFTGIQLGSADPQVAQLSARISDFSLIQ